MTVKAKRARSTLEFKKGRSLTAASSRAMSRDRAE